MAWKRVRDPKLTEEPTFQHPRRCMSCGHLDSPDQKLGIDEAHDPVVGCLVEGGTKYIEDEAGNGHNACACLGYVSKE